MPGPQLIPLTPAQLRRAADLAAIEAHIARHGVTRGVDHGDLTPAVEALKARGDVVCRYRGGGGFWNHNGGKITVSQLRKRGEDALRQQQRKRQP